VDSVSFGTTPLIFERLGVVRNKENLVMNLSEVTNIEGYFVRCCV
jgi:hypothetical protein